MNHQDTKSPGEGGQEREAKSKTEFDPIPADTDRIASQVVDAAFKVHKTLGPGLLESVYEACLTHELSQRGLLVERQIAVPVLYEGIRLDAGFRLDMLVGKQVVVEIKAVDEMNPVYEAQLLTYLKLTGHRVGLLINFNVAVFKRGAKRLVI